MAVQRVPTWVALAACAPLVVAALAMTVDSLALAGDGSFYLVRLLAEGEVFGADQRYLGNAVRQSGVLIGMQLGVTSTHAFALLLGVGQLVVPAVAWSLAILLARVDRVVFTAVAVAAGISAGTTWFFNASESVLAMPLTVLVAVLLWRPPRWSGRDAAVAIGASAILVSTYEAAMVTGLILSVWAGWRARRARSRLERSACWIVSALATLSVVVAARGGWEHTYPSHSRSLLYFVVELDPWPLYVALVGLGTLLAGASLRLEHRTRVLLIAAGAGALFVSALALQMSMSTAFAARGGVGVVVLGLLAFLWRSWTIADRARPESPGWLLVVPVLFVVTIVSVNLLAVREWRTSFSAFRGEVDAAQGVVAAEDVLPAGSRDVLWSWSASTLSLVVRGEPTAGLLVDSRPSFVPFEPSAARAQIADRYSWNGR